MDEKVLIRQIKAGNDDAFRVLVEKYRNDLYRTVFAILRNERDAEDATQEIFLKIYHSLPQYEHQGLKTWMTRVAVNHAIDFKRKVTRRQEDVGEVIEQVHIDETSKQVIQKELRRLVRDKLAEIPDNYREVIYEYYIAERSYQQIADKHNIAVKTVETKLYRARSWMKRNWKEDEFS